MPTQRYSRTAREVAEPPRDGEFFFLEDVNMEERLAGILERTVRQVWRGLDRLGLAVGRHPVLFLAGAVAVGAAATSAFIRM